MRWHDRLKWLKYGVFFGLLAVSMFSMGAGREAGRGGAVQDHLPRRRVEPRLALRAVRGGAAGAVDLHRAAVLQVPVPARRRAGDALAPSAGSACKRKQECNSCKACAVGCGSLAIDEHGRIDHRECLHCLDCMVLYYRRARLSAAGHRSASAATQGRAAAHRRSAATATSSRSSRRRPPTPSMGPATSDLTPASRARDADPDPRHGQRTGDARRMPTAARLRRVGCRGTATTSGRGAATACSDRRAFQAAGVALALALAVTRRLGAGGRLGGCRSPA
ncbi:MAG: hypothetical protein MZW92_74655 [Comamonadaceae bacterium]|nr:hypothetical protein [Comamonadaceae bacterium]